ncbi:MAG: NifB/NifX family molybdenum-iron cluster-binding protein [Bacteroidetes bacterium]|nr:NifB/NifX family molybdenum-iron cluster-binding protein [Bacteroidota bacterium]
MTIAISASGNGWKERLDERFGRAQGFFLIDSENGNTRFLDNTSNVDAAHGAGTGTAQSLLSEGVGVVITGRVGPKAAEALNAAGVTVVTVVEECTVEEAWRNYEASKKR